MSRRRANPDPRLRELARAAVSGDRDAAVRLYWETRRIRGPREHVDAPDYVLETGFGPVRLIPQGDAIRVLSPGPGHAPVPVVVNRVPYAVSGRYFRYEDLGWVPVDPESVEHARRQGVGVDLYDHTSMWLNTMSLGRIGFPRLDATVAAFHKFMSRFHPLLLSWIESHPEEMRVGALVDVNNDMWRLQEDADKLRAKLDKVEVRLAEAVVREAVLGGGVA